MRIEEALSPCRENMPDWLRHYVPKSRVDIPEIMKGRIVYYPGSREDGEPVRVFNKAHFAHLFLYVDYGLSETELRSMLYDDAFWGYRVLDVQNYSERDLCPDGWTPHHRMTPDEMERVRGMVSYAGGKPYCLLAVFERKPGFGDEHGARRFAILFLMADGIAAYDALFVSRRKAPQVLVLQDHGFGGNYSHFGQGYLLEEIAVRYQTLPGMIFCNEGTHVWDGYDRYSFMEPDTSEGRNRSLFHRRKDRPAQAG